MRISSGLAVSTLLGLFSVAAGGQAPAPGVPTVAVPADSTRTEPAPGLSSTYVLGPDDQITVQIPNADEISGKPVRIDLNGDLRLPQVGRIQAAGLTVEQLEARIAERLKEFLKAPDVSISVTEFRSQPVSVIGSVRNPGVQQLQGRKTLLEVLAQAGGLTEDAGSTVKITRRLERGRVPLPGAADDASGQFSVAEADLRQLMNADSPANNIVIYPQDVISVPRTRISQQMVYVLGAVQRAGGFILGERGSLSTLHALALAGGADKGASPKSARILRPTPGGSFKEFPVDLTKLMAAKTPDVLLQPEDILFVPSSKSKKFFSRLSDVIALTASAAVYRIP